MKVNELEFLRQTDPQLVQAMDEELGRQREHIELIASENFVSRAVLEAAGSVLTNKYAEGYPGRRYYGGCEFVDKVEDLARERACQLFGADHANVQPHSGSQANTAVYMSVLEPGDVVLGMNLSHGGHLTHGSPVNISGLLYTFHEYGVEQGSEVIDYDKVMEIALQCQPKMIVAGASAYSRALDFAKFRDIALAVDAYLMVDMAHIAGLVAVGLHQNPVPYSDFVTSTTHKTLRGPRGGLILTTEEYARTVDKTIFPGIQGGPLMHVIAAKAAAFQEALQPEFRTYQEKVLANAKALAAALQRRGFHIVSGGTDNHLMLVDLRSKEITGKDAEELLDTINITCNKNTVPFETASAFVTSGIRLGSPAVTSRGFDEEAMDVIAEIMNTAITNRGDHTVLQQCRQQVLQLCAKFPLY